MIPTISDYYRAAIEALKNEVEATTDADVIGRDHDDWYADLIEKHGMVPIEIDASRGEKLVEVEREHVLRGYDVCTDQMPGSVVKTNDVRIEVPVVPSDTLEVIAIQHLATNPFSISFRYPPFEYDHGRGMVSMVAAATSEAIERARDIIHKTIRDYNDNITKENQQFPAEVARVVTAKRERVSAKNKGLDELSVKLGIPLVKKADIATVVSTTVKVRAKIAPVMPATRKAQKVPVLDAKSFRAIIELLESQCQQFERTPQVFSEFQEEGLRDTILGSLNAVFEGAAGGETFRGNGKVDIHLQIAQGEVFICEIKFWRGPGSLDEVVAQLRGRLTWRDSYGVGIVFSLNTGFTEVLAAVQQKLPGLPGCVPESLHQMDEHHFVERFAIPSDEARAAEIHILVYNLYLPNPGRRAIKRR